MNKIIGYILSLAGIVGIASTTVPQVAAILPFLAKFSSTTVTIASVVLVLVGVFLIMKSGGRKGKLKKGAEVPIFHGRNVVGYRRH